MPRHTEAERKKNRVTGGTNRVQTADLGSQPLTRIGASGDRKNLVTSRAIQTGGAGDGVGRTVGRSTLGFEQPQGGTPGTLKRFRESAKGLTPDDPSLTNIQALSRVRGEQVRPVSARDSRLKPIGGTDRTVRPQEPVNGSGLRRGEGRLTSISVEEQDARVGPKLRSGRFAKGGFTDIGTFKRGAGKKTLREEAIEGKKDIGSLFGNAAELAKLFSSKEFQSRKAKGIQAAAGVKGRRADTKAKTERIKALSGVLEDLSATGGDNETLISRIQEQIQNLIAGDGGGGVSSDVVGQLAGKFDDDQIKTILGIIR